MLTTKTVLPSRRPRSKQRLAYDDRRNRMRSFGVATASDGRKHWKQNERNVTWLTAQPSWSYRIRGPPKPVSRVNQIRGLSFLKRVSSMFCPHLNRLALFLILVSLFVSPTIHAQDSLADTARKNRSKDAPVTTKRSWTSDDMASARDTDQVAPPKTPEEASETLRQFRLLGKEELGTAILRIAGANVDFPNRKDWEQKLFDAKQAWLLQVDRMVADKDAAKDSRDDELRQAIGTQRNFERIKSEGIQQARAVNDPVLKAHLAYQRQQEFCKQTTGDLLTDCLASLDQLKWKIQREGIW
jgi:hypothetical protein